MWKELLKGEGLMKELKSNLGLSAAIAIVLVGLVALVASSKLTATAHSDDEAAVREVLASERIKL